MDNIERQALLIKGLVGPHKELYLGVLNKRLPITLNTFTVVIDTLANSLPVLIDLIADGSKWRDFQASEEYQKRLRGEQ